MQSPSSHCRLLSFVLFLSSYGLVRHVSGAVGFTDVADPRNLYRFRPPTPCLARLLRREEQRVKEDRRPLFWDSEDEDDDDDDDDTQGEDEQEDGEKGLDSEKERWEEQDPLSKETEFRKLAVEAASTGLTFGNPRIRRRARASVKILQSAVAFPSLRTR